MADRTFFEGLADKVAGRFRAQAPAPTPPAQTTEVKPETDHDDILPLDGTGAYGYYDRNLRLTQTRLGLYAEYDTMDEQCPEYNAALDIIADNATRGDSDGEPGIYVRADSPKVAAELTALRDDLGLVQASWPLARDVAKYGERAEEVIVNKDFRIERLKPLPTQFIIPQRDEYGRTDPDAAFHQLNAAGEVVARFADWQVLYAANLKSRSHVTGTGVGFAARRVFKQLSMMEDAVCIARLTRAHTRLGFMVDTGDLLPAEAQKHLNRVKAAFRKRRMIDPRTGRMDTSYNPLSIEEDLFIATSKESKADIKVLQGDLTLGNLNDLEWFLDRMCAQLKVPRTYLHGEKGKMTSKGVITSQDIQFARAVRRIQSILQDSYRKLCDLALLLRGINPKTATYRLGFPVISIIDDLRYWQTEQLKMLVAQMMKTTFWPSDEWVFTHLLGYDQTQIAELLAWQTKPDKYNGLWQPRPQGGAAQVGAVANNAKVGASESMFQGANRTAREEFIAQMQRLPEAEYQQVVEAVENLRLLSDWSLEALALA